MESGLEQLLADIHPAVTTEQTNRRADDALNSFEVRTAVISDWEEFTACMGNFFAHVEAKVLGLQKSLCAAPSLHWPRCIQMLHRIYGPSGDKVAFEKARTGNEGGLYNVLKALALTMGEQYAENEINARVIHYWEQLTVDEQLAAATEYLDKYGHLLPTEMTDGTAARIRVNFPKVLQMHPYLLQKIRRVGR